MVEGELSSEAFADLGAPEMVYIRPVTVQDIVAADPQAAIRGRDFAPDQVFYALHGADGVRLAVLADRDAAYATAIAHELAPVAVH